MSVPRPHGEPASFWTGQSLPAGTLGVCPLLAKSTTLLSALAMGAALIATLALSAATLFLCRSLVPLHARLAFLLLVTTTWVTVAQLLFQAWWFPMAEHLGIYVALLAVNCVVLERLESALPAASARAPLADAVRAAVPLALFVAAVGALREAAATGALLGDLALLHDGTASMPAAFPVRLPVLATPAGAFLAFALLAAAVRALPDRRPQ